MNITQFLEGSFLISGGLFSFFWGLNLVFMNSKLKKMSWILWIASLWLFSGSYVFTGIHLKYPQFFLLHLPFVYAVGPLFFAYYKNEILEEKVPRFTFHFLVCFVVCILILPYHLKSIDEKLFFLESMKSGQTSIYHIIIVLLNFGTKISILGYLSIILWENRFIFQKNLGESEKNKKIFLFMIGFLFLDLLIGFLGFLFQSFFLIKLSALLLPINLYLFFVASSKYPEMIIGIQTEIKKARYEQSKIKNLNIDEILEKIKITMETEKAFADEDITLSSLAQDLGISAHQLSQILNERLTKTFPQFINEYRISEAKKMILEEKNRQFISVAFAVGFNSKASFNRAFKQITGITPQKYRKNYS